MSSLIEASGLENVSIIGHFQAVNLQILRLHYVINDNGWISVVVKAQHAGV